VSADTGCLDPDVPHDLDVTFENDAVIVGNCKICGDRVEGEKQESGYG
jgi:hypothetical protein